MDWGMLIGTISSGCLGLWIITVTYRLGRLENGVAAISKLMELQNEKKESVR